MCSAQRRARDSVPRRSDAHSTRAAWSRRLESVCCSARGHVIPAPWHDMLRACSAVEVFDFFHSAGLATHSYRHHCLAALRRESFPQFAHRVRPSIRPSEPNDDVQALFDAALRQQLQGPPCAGAAQRAVSGDRSRHSPRRKPHAGFSGEESSADRCRCWKSPTDAISPSPTPSSGMSAAALRWPRSHGSNAPKRCNGCSSSSTRSSPISARPISGCRWSRAAATCRRMRWRTGWSAAMPRFR